MPELPEVYTITKDLYNNILKYTIKECSITKGYIAHPSNITFINAIKNKKIIHVERIAKNILFHLDNSHIIHFHLAMTGQILLKNINITPVTGWLRVLFKIQNKSQVKYLMFNDMRMFGKVALLNNNDREKLLNKYGPEPIKENLTAFEFIEKIKSKKTNIKNALLDQSLVSGLGNIYATDALYLAGINPLKSTKDITNKEGEILLKSAKQVLLEGISNRGTTLSDKKYVDISGNDRTHSNHFKIYSKSVCPKCGGAVEYKKINRRGSYFCIICQQ